MIPTYKDHFRRCLNGFRSEPRGLVVHEVYNVSLLFRPGEIPGRRKLNVKIGIMEGLQFIAGIFKPEWIAAVAPKARLDLFTPQAAYGPRTADQMPIAENALRHDMATRRAQVILARPSEVGTADLPCTTAIQFAMQPGGLHTTFTMRSSDAVWGLPYDLIQFGMVTMAMAHCLKVDVAGSLINIGNAHVYEATQDLGPEEGRGCGFTITRNFIDWFEAGDWAFAQAERLASNHPMEGIVINEY